jgi:hypothetical protein
MNIKLLTGIVILNIFIAIILIFFTVKYLNQVQYTQNTLENQNQYTPNSSVVDKNQYDSLPSYVPPKDGGNNKNWCGYRNRNLLKDRKCYFGNGLKHRYRWGQR